MFNDINLRDAITRERELAREKGAVKFVYDVFEVLNDEVYTEHRIRTRVENSKNSGVSPQMKLSMLDEERLFSIDEIRKTCIKYRLRFLDSSHFHGELPNEAVVRIKELEKAHECVFENFKMVAPSEVFKLGDCEKDPLLFIQLDKGIYYLVHQWGRDLSWSRKLWAFPIRSLTSLTFSIVVVSVLLSLFVPTSLMEGTVLEEEGLARMTFFLWALVGIGACVSYVGLAFFKNVSASQWNSPFFKKNS